MPVGKEMTDTEKIKKFLKSYLRCRMAAVRLQEQINELRLDRLFPRGIMGDGMPKGSDVGDLSEYAAKIDELERKLLDKMKELIETFAKVQTAIDGLDSEVEKSVLTYRYIRGMKWEEIAAVMSYSWQYIHKIHASALQKVKIK